MFPVVVQPDADEGLQAFLVGDGGDQLVTLGAGERPDPPDKGFDDRQALAYLVLANLRARGLAFGIGAKRQSMNPVLEKFANEPAQIIDAKGGDIDAGQRHPAFVEIRHCLFLD